MYLIPGISGFIACCLFDINKIKWHSKKLNLLFVLGILGIAGSTLYAIVSGGFTAMIEHFGPQQILFGAGLILSLAMLIYTLFFALPFESTYAESDAIPVVNRGIYGVCRHPGFWLLAFVYLFLWLLCSTRQTLYAFLTYTLCNFLYVYIQDRYIFPQYIRGYEEYKQKVPFLVPTEKSIQNAFRR